MNLLASLNTHIGKLVHPALQAKPHEFIVQRNFLASRLAVSVGALIAAPICLVLGDAPLWWEAVVLAWLLLPAAAVAAVSRTGNLERGEAFSLAAWIGLALTLAFGSGAQTGFALLLIVPIEAALASTSLSKTGAVAMALAAVAAVAIGARIGLGERVAAGPIVEFGAGITTAALIYTLVLAVMASRFDRRRRRDEVAALERYQDLAEVIDGAPMELDRSGMVLSAGQAVHRLFGVKPRDMMGRGLFEHVHVADRPLFLKLVADAADAAGSQSTVVRFRTGATLPSSKGAFLEPVFAWAELRASRRGAAMSGRSGSILCLMSDVSVRESQGAALRQAEEATREAGAGRTLFLANVSHELRTPLNAIIGFADLLSNESLGPRDPAKQREYASIILQSGHHLLAMVNTILDASKIEAGSFSIVPEAFDLTRLVHCCRDMVSLKAETSGIAFSCDLAAGLDEVIGDERAYKQILLNLLSNAIKFTPSGGRVGVSVKPEGTSLVIAVTDNGVGIKAGDLPKLGAPFFQAQNAYDRAFDGTGLGLSVVRGLVGLHGGSMAIESAPGQGTRVCVRMPSDCRSSLKSNAVDTKIETIPRYSASSQQSVGHVEFARIHKIA